MKNLLIILLFVVISVGAYKLIVGSQTDMEQLSYVPADTPIFSAQLKPIDIQAYLASIGVLSGQMEQVSEMLKSELSSESEPNALFFMHLFEEYAKAISTPNEFTNMTGMNSELRSLFYMVGVSPVIQVELSKPTKFLAMFDRAQQASNIAYTQESIDGVYYHRYELDVIEGIELLVRATDDWGVITFHSTKFDTKHLTTSLAITKPDEDIVSSGKFDKIIEEYQLRNSAIGFFSTEELGRTATTLDGNALAKDMLLLGGEDFINELEDMRTPACQTDIAMLTALWPGIYMDSEITTSAEGSDIKARVLIPSSSKTAIQSLQALRGFIPEFANGISSGLFHMAMGTDVASLNTSINKMWSAMTDLELSCPPLVDMQQELKRNNPIGAFAMAGVANGLMGLGLSVDEIDVAGMQTGTMKLDAVVSVSATNVRTLYSTLQSFIPFLKAIDLPKEGDELILNEALPMLDQFGLELIAMASDQHLVLFTGDKGRELASQTLSEELKKNGMMSMSVDYQEFFSQMLPLMEMSGQPIPPDLESMMETNMAISMKTDVSEHGIEFNTEMFIKK